MRWSSASISRMLMASVLWRGTPVTSTVRGHPRPADAGYRSVAVPGARQQRRGSKGGQVGISQRTRGARPNHAGRDVERGADARGPLAHADDAVAVEAAGRPAGSRCRRRRRGSSAGCRRTPDVTATVALAWRSTLVTPPGRCATARAPGGGAGGPCLWASSLSSRSLRRRTRSSELPRG
jgi:hypothetical protein